ncbi:MAG TPA: hypothetical protein VF678_15965 [bacterium]
MKPKTIHCEECVEEIPGDEVYWEDDRLYCGRCGSELDISKEASDLLDTFQKRRTAKWETANDDVGEDDDLEEDEEFDEEDEDDDWEMDEDEDEEEEEEPEEEEEEAEEEDNGGGRRRR